MNRVTHLSKTQKADICAHYAEGMTSTQLAQEYGVSHVTILRVIKANENFVQQCTEKKKEAEERALKSMDEWVQEKQNVIQGLIGKIIASVEKTDFDEESLRDKVGAIKILREAFVPKSQVQDENEKTEAVKIEIVEADHGEG